MEDEILLGIVPSSVKQNLETLWLNVQREGVDGGMATSAAIEKLETYQKALEQVPCNQ